MRTTRIFLGSPNYSPCHPQAQFVDAPLPPGYRRVWSGVAKCGDLYPHCVLLHAGILHWLPIREQDLQDRNTSTVDGYLCLIRPDGEVEVEQPCERCQAFRRWHKWRFCRSCGKQNIREAKQQCR